MLLHGQPGTGADWQPVIDRLDDDLVVLALDRPGYGSNPHPAGDFATNACAVLESMDRAGIDRAIVVGHSYGGGVALAVAALAPERVEGLVLLASVGPGCLNRWDHLLAAPLVGTLCAVTAWSWTPRLVLTALARMERRRGRSLTPDEHVMWQVWAHAGYDHGPVWRSFLTEQRVLVRGLDGLEAGLSKVAATVLVLADPRDTMVPLETAHALCAALPSARLQLVHGAGHHLPVRAPGEVADAIAQLAAPGGEAQPPGGSSARWSSSRSAGERPESSAS